MYGHDVVLFATPGPMIEVAERRLLRVISAPLPRGELSFCMMRALREAVRRERPDVIHAWDWPQCLNSFYAAHLLHGIPMVLTDMTSGPSIVRFLPKTLLTTFGTPEFVDRARAAGRKRVELLLPPVDTDLNSPNIVDPRPFEEQYKIQAKDINLVTVSRLSANLKLESLRRTIDAIRILGPKLPLRLVIIGDGDARAQLERLSTETNAELGRMAVTLTGTILDPRPAYAAADVVIGMGGSALRGAAFGKPVIIVGEQGFSTPLTPQTEDSLYYHGIYGIGDGNPNNARLIRDIKAFIDAKEQLDELGVFSRQFVINHFALDKVCAQLDRFCRAAVDQRRKFSVAAVDGMRTAVIFKLGKHAPHIIRQAVKRGENFRNDHVNDPNPILSIPK